MDGTDASAVEPAKLQSNTAEGLELVVASKGKEEKETSRMTLLEQYRRLEV